MTEHSFLQFYLVCQGKNKNSGPDNNIQMTPSYSWDIFLWKTKQLCAFARIISYVLNSAPSCNIQQTPTHSFTHVHWSLALLED